MNTTSIELSPLLMTAVRTTWAAIAYDLGECDDEEAIEVCCDADRLEMFGGIAGKEANQELKVLCKAHGFRNVVAAIVAKEGVAR